MWHLHLRLLSRINCASVFKVPQQIWNLAGTRVRDETNHARRTGVQVDAVRLCENGIAFGNVERSGMGIPAEN